MLKNVGQKASKNLPNGDSVRFRKLFPLKHWYLSTKLHVVISQKTATFILAYYVSNEENHEKELE